MARVDQILMANSIKVFVDGKPLKCSVAISADFNDAVRYTITGVVPHGALNSKPHKTLHLDLTTEGESGEDE